MTDSNLNTKSPTVSIKRLRWRLVDAEQRCTNPKNKCYHRYGGRGIRFCKGLTVKSLLRIIGNAPSARHQIDRENNDSHYSCGECVQCKTNNWPLNIRWVTPARNARNSSHVIMVRYKGKTQTLSDWIEELGMPFNLVKSRVWNGWDPIRALTEPKHGG